MNFMTRIILTVMFLVALYASCDKNKNSKPEINIKNITINNQGTDLDNIEIGYNDTLKIYLELSASMKDINSFTTKYKDLKNYKLEISDYDKNSTRLEGNAVATVPGEDCTILFKDGTYKTDITVTTIIKDNDKENTELFFYLFSEEETDIKQLEIKLLR